MSTQVIINLPAVHLPKSLTFLKALGYSRRRPGKRAAMTVGRLAVMLVVVSAVSLASPGHMPGSAVSAADPPEPLVLKGHAEKVSAVTWFLAVGGTDEALLASASHDKTVRVWNPDTGKEVALLRHKDAVLSVASYPGGTILASATGTEKTIRIWSNITGTPEERSLRMRHDGGIRVVAWRPGGSTLATAGGDVQVCDPNPVQQKNDYMVEIPDAGIDFRASLFAHKGAVSSLAWRPDGKVVASGGADNMVRLGEPATGGHAVLAGHTGPVYSMTWRPPDGKVLASASADKTVRLWDPAAAKKAFNVNWGPYGHPDPPAGKASTVIRHPTPVFSVAWSPDGKTLATAGSDGIIRLWNAPGEPWGLSSEKPTATLMGHKGRVNSVAWRPDGKALASAGDDKTVRIWPISAAK